MKRTTINEVRKVLFDRLKEYDGEPIKLDFSKEMLREILFDKRFEGNYFFANYDEETREIYKKLDYSNVSFDNFGEYHPGFSFEGFKGVRINPQTLHDSFFKGVSFNGVTFINGFDGVNIEGANFRGSIGAVINPQKISKKSLNETILADTIIIGSFNGVSIRNTNFSGAKGKIKINPQALLKKEYIDLSGTNFDGVIFTGAFNKCLIEGANFKGSSCAVINPQTIHDKNLSYTILDGVTLIGRNIINKDLYEGVSLVGTDFRGSLGDLKVNPQTVYRKELNNAILEGVEFIGSFDDVEVINSDFAGSIGAIINPQTIYNGFLMGTKLCDVEFIGLFKNANIKGANFTGSNGAVIDPQIVYQKDMSSCVLKDATVINEFFDVITDNMDLEDSILVEPNLRIDSSEEEKQKQYCIGKINKAFKTRG